MAALYQTQVKEGVDQETVDVQRVLELAEDGDIHGMDGRGKAHGLGGFGPDVLEADRSCVPASLLGPFVVAARARGLDANAQARVVLARFVGTVGS